MRSVEMSRLHHALLHNECEVRGLELRSSLHRLALWQGVDTHKYLGQSNPFLQVEDQVPCPSSRGLRVSVVLASQTINRNSLFMYTVLPHQLMSALGSLSARKMNKAPVRVPTSKAALST